MECFDCDHIPHIRNNLASTVGSEDLEENPMVTIRNMNIENPTDMIKVLQQQMLEMQQHYERELAA